MTSPSKPRLLLGFPAHASHLPNQEPLISFPLAPDPIPPRFWPFDFLNLPGACLLFFSSIMIPRVKRIVSSLDRFQMVQPGLPRSCDHPPCSKLFTEDAEQLLNKATETFAAWCPPASPAPLLTASSWGFCPSLTTAFPCLQAGRASLH